MSLNAKCSFCGSDVPELCTPEEHEKQRSTYQGLFDAILTGAAINVKRMPEHWRIRFLRAFRAAVPDLDCKQCGGTGSIRDTLQHHCGSCYYGGPHDEPSRTCPKCEGCKCDECESGNHQWAKVDPDCPTCKGAGEVPPRLRTPTLCPDCIGKKA